MGKDLSGQAPGGSRTVLANVLPLRTPLVVQIFPIYACNFKCNYCIFQLRREERGFISDKITMDFGLYKKFIDEFALFPEKLKVLRFVGIGEPLLHPNIVDMVKYAVDKQVAHTVEMLTNGSLLTPTMSSRLIVAGLSRLVVSLQGVSAAKYKETCGVDINFNRLCANLEYFFRYKGNAHMYCKIVDSALDGEEDKKRFYELFEHICDSLAIEHTVPIHSGVDFDAVIKHPKEPLTQFGLPVSEVKVCPQPFFHMQINPDGKVVPCYSFEYPQFMGDCNKQTVQEIWNGKTFNAFRRSMLINGKLGACPICKECNIITYRMFPEDMIGEADAMRLKSLY